MVWPLVLLLSFGVASLMAAAQHGPWWLKVLGLLFTLTVMGTWSLRSPSLAGWAGWPVLATILIVAMLVLVIIRWRRGFAWWEFAVMWALVGLAMTIGVAETREAKIYGSDLNPLNLQQTASVLGYLVPAGRDGCGCLGCGGHRTRDRGSDPERAAVSPSRDGYT